MKYLNLRREGLIHSQLRVQSVMAGKTWQECETARHVASAIGKQREINADVSSFLLLIQSGTPAFVGWATLLQGQTSSLTSRDQTHAVVCP